MRVQKNFFAIFSLFAVVLLSMLTSCQKDENESSVSNDSNISIVFSNLLKPGRSSESEWIEIPNLFSLISILFSDKLFAEMINLGRPRSSK